MRDPNSQTGLAIVAAVAIVIVGLLSMGCGGNAEEGLAVSGTITLDGRPLDDGHVTLRPLGEGPAVSGETADGRYQFDPPEGLAAGPHVVEIVAIRPTGEVIPHPDFPGETLEPTKNIVPPRYSRNSPLTVVLVAGGENHFDFNLKTRPR